MSQTYLVEMDSRNPEQQHFYQNLQLKHQVMQSSS